MFIFAATACSLPCRIAAPGTPGREPGAQVRRAATHAVDDSEGTAGGATFDDAALLAGLETFGDDADARRVVARHARDLADSGRYAEDAGVELSPEHVVVQLADAPRGGPVERWNWWIGSLELAFGGYAEFRVRRLG